MPSKNPKSLRGNRVLLFILMALAPIWYQTIGYSGAFDLGIEAGSSIHPVRLTFIIASAVGALICAWADRKLQIRQPVAHLALSLLFFLGVSAFSFARYQTLMPVPLLATIGAALMGLLFSWIFVSFMSLFYDYGSLWEFVLLETLAQATMVLGLNRMFAYIPASTQIYITLVASCGLTFTLWSAQKRMPQTYKSPAKKVSPQIGLLPLFRNQTFRVQIIILIAISLASTVLRVTGAGGAWGDVRSYAPEQSFSLAIASAALYVTLTLVAISIFIRLRSWRAIQFPFLILIAGFFLIAMFRADFGEREWFYALKMAIELYSQTLFMLIVVLCMRKLPLSPQRCVGVSLAIPSLFLLLWMIFLEGTSSTFSSVIMACSYLLVLLVAMLGHRGTPGTAAGEPTTDGTTQTSLAQAVNSIANNSGLSPRETEVFALLAQGRSLPYIQKELFISEGTTRTHVKHIYEKLNIHSRQELLDLIAE